MISFPPPRVGWAGAWLAALSLGALPACAADGDLDGSEEGEREWAGPDGRETSTPREDTGAATLAAPPGPALAKEGWLVCGGTPPPPPVLFEWADLPDPGAVAIVDGTLAAHLVSQLDEDTKVTVAVELLAAGEVRRWQQGVDGALAGGAVREVSLGLAPPDLPLQPAAMPAPGQLLAHLRVERPDGRVERVYAPALYLAPTATPGSVRVYGAQAMGAALADPVQAPSLGTAVASLPADPARLGALYVGGGLREAEVALLLGEDPGEEAG